MKSNQKFSLQAFSWIRSRHPRTCTGDVKGPT